ncbi:MAG: MFS transporter [Pseudomonadota bacterium]
MSSALNRLGTLLVAAFILLTGHGLQLALVPLRAELSGWSVDWIGWIGTSYFAGFLLGCFTVPSVVSAVGHVRTFGVLTAVGAGSLLALALIDSPWGWLLLRVASGWAISGLYLVMESWLNEMADGQRRGTVLSIYTVLVLVAIASGQQLLAAGDPLSTDMLVLGALFILLAAVPVGLTRAPVPQPLPAFRFSIGELFRASRAATLATFCAGLITGAFWTLVPALLAKDGWSRGDTGTLLAATIAGGALLQLPLGRLSDRVDRRLVLAAMTTAGALVCGLLGGGAGADLWTALLVMGLLGGCVMPVYSIALAHANDNSSGDFLRIGTTMLLMNTLGSMSGPIAVTTLARSTTGLDPDLAGYFVFSTGVFAVATAIVLLMMLLRRAPRAHFEAYELNTRSTQGAFALDPRSDDDSTLTSTGVRSAPQRHPDASRSPHLPPEPSPEPRPEP